MNKVDIPSGHPETTIVLITGANTGVGYQTVRTLLKSERRYIVLMAGRSRDKLEQAAKELQAANKGESTLDTVIVDLEKDETIEQAAKWVEDKYGRIDTLVNNAGAEFDIQYPKLGWTLRDAFYHTFNINVFGTHLLTTALAPLLLKSSHPRLLFFSSGTASLWLSEDDTFILNKVPAPGWPKETFRELPAYKSSKVALNMIMRDWERVLRADGVWVGAIDPGFYATGLGGDPEVTRKIGAGDVGEAGPWVVEVIEGGQDQHRGKIVTGQGGKDGLLPW